MSAKPTYEELAQRVSELEDAAEETRRIEAALEQSERRYRSIFGRSTSLITSVNRDGIVVDCNSRVQQILGYRPDEIIGQPMGKIIHTEDLGRAQENLRGILENGSPDKAEYRMVRKGGSHVDVIIDSAAVEDGDGNYTRTICIVTDITYRKRIERAMREGADFLRAIYEGSGLGIFVVKVNGPGDYVYEGVNPQHEKLFGIPNDDIVGKTPGDLTSVFGEQAIDYALGLYDKCVQTKDFIESEAEIRVDGEDQWWLSLLTPLIDDAGSVYRIIGGAINITARKRAESALDDALHFSESIVARSPVGIGIFEVTTGRCVSTNQTIAELVGGSQEQLLEQNLYQIASWKEPGLLETAKATIADGTSRNQIADLVTTFGKRVAIQYHFACFSSGAMKYLLLTASDITQRIRTEEELKRSQDLYRALFENNPVDTIVVDREGKIVTFNLVKEATGERIPEVGSVMYRDYAGKHGIDMYAELMGSIRSGEGREFLDLEYGDRFLRIRIAPFSGGAIITSIDTTPVRKLETELQQAHKMEAIGTLAGGIAHDFNNILGIILGNTELAIDDVPEWNPAKESLREIRHATMRAKDVVRQILSFSRHSLIERQPLRLTPILEDTLTLLRSSIPTTIEIHKHLDADTDVILGDPAQLSQVIMNLCTNAYQAMGNGGTLSVDLMNSVVDRGSGLTIAELPAGQYVRLTVKDTGPGIDPEHLSRIFDPYFTTKKVGEGTGMGLAVARGIVTNCGGEIVVDSERGKGTAFHVYLPLADAEAAMRVDAPPSLPRGTERVLFVDDEAGLARAYSAAISSLGYSVITFTGPKEALERFREDRDAFDLVITDMTMPELTGEALTRELQKIRPDIPIIVCTGHSEEMAEETVRRLGIADYALKPISKPDIASTIRRALDKAKGGKGQ